MEQENKIQLEIRNSITIIDIQGDVTASSESSLNEAYKQTNEQAIQKILLKFDQNAFINSSGIALIIQLLAETKRNNQQIAITGISDHFKKIFDLVGITKFAKVYNTVDEGFQDLSESK